MMKKDKLTKYVIKHRNSEMRKNVGKLSYLWCLILILGIAALLLIGSYYCFICNPWLSGVLVSTSCGCFTGATFYFLVNIRANKEQRIQREYDAIKNTYERIRSVLNFGMYYQFTKKILLSKRDIFDDGYEILLILDEIQQARNQIGLSVYNNVPNLGYDPLDRDNIDQYRDMIHTSEDKKSMEQSILYICDKLLPAADYLKSLLQEREDQISFIHGYFL